MIKPEQTDEISVNREQQLEEALLQKELLSSIFDTVPCGILRLTRKGASYGLISINPAAIRLLGYQEVELSQLDWSSGIADTVLAEDYKILLDSYQNLQKQGDSLEVAYRVRWQDGSIHWLKGSNSIVSDCDGVQIIQRMFIDVTESKELQEQLWREQEMYRLAMESSSDVMYEYTVDTDTLVAYEPQVDAAGHSYVEKVEFPCYETFLQQEDFVHPDDLLKFKAHICYGVTTALEVRLRITEKMQEDYQWYRVTGKAIEHAGRLYRVVGTFRNIHREKQDLGARREELRMSQAVLQAINGSYLSIYYVDFQQDCFYGMWLPGMDATAQYVRKEGLHQQLCAYIENEVVADGREKFTESRAFTGLSGENPLVQRTSTATD